MADPITIAQVSLAVVSVAAYATNLAAQVGAFNKFAPKPGGVFNVGDETQAAADLEVSDIQRRQGARQAIFAGDTFVDLELGAPQIIGVSQDETDPFASDPISILGTT
jgi:hypothetical protein